MFGQGAQMEMGFPPAVEIQLSMPTCANAASLQRPAEAREPLIALPLLYHFPLIPPPPSLSLGTQLCCHLSYIQLFGRAGGVYTGN